MRAGQVVAAVIIVLSAQGAAAEDAVVPTTRVFEAGMYGGIWSPSDTHEFLDPTVAEHDGLKSIAGLGGVRFGFYPIRFVGVELEGDYTFAETDQEGNVHLFGLRGQAVVQVPLRVTPFVVAGAGTAIARSGERVLGNDEDAIAHLGAGAKLWATSRWHVRLDGRLQLAPRLRRTSGDDRFTSHFSVMLGAAVAFGIGARGGDEPALEPDPDGDGFRGDRDKCPLVSGFAPDGCRFIDGDGDGVEDREDRCPAEQETRNGFEDDDGCPDTLPDSDSDGHNDHADECPDDPEDLDGFEDGDGCPDPDNDKDGVVDDSDACPLEAGPLENRGCPDADGDGDGVVDRLDNCPAEAGTPENQGCVEKQLVVISKTKLEILDKVYFRSNSAKLHPRSFRLLDNVANVLRAHPEIAAVRIEGHTDDRGRDSYNKTLSQRRASAVMAYLVQKGVAAARLEAIGHGEEKPLEDNSTEIGRSANRRVEFNIVESTAPEPAPAPAPTEDN